jgi:hypothetical protein
VASSQQPNRAQNRDRDLAKLVNLIDALLDVGRSPGNSRQGLLWTKEDIAEAFGWVKTNKAITKNVVTQRIKRMRDGRKPSRPNEVWFKALLNMFFGEDIAALDDQARSERVELIALYAATAARRPPRKRQSSAKAMAVVPSAPHRDPLGVTPRPTDLQHHCALTDGDHVFYVGSRLDTSDTNPFGDGEGVLFPRRHIYVGRLNRHTGAWKVWYLTRGRPAHMAMRVVGSHLCIFINLKMSDETFAMRGTRFLIDREKVETRDVRNIFDGRNWGWSPSLDDQGEVHHGDSETTGNPYRIGQDTVPGKAWGDATQRYYDWLRTTCPHSWVGADRDSGYLLRLDIPLSYWSDPASELATAAE